MAIAVIFILQASWFVAWMSLDQVRIDANRNSFFPWIIHEKFKPSECSKIEVGQVVFKKLGMCLSYRLTQVAVILVTVGLFAIGIYGSVQIRAGVDEKQLLPVGSYLEQFLSQHYDSYPNTGWPGYVYSGAIEYTLEDLNRLDTITEGFNGYQKEGRFVKEPHFWWSEFKTFMSQDKGVDDWRTLLEIDEGKLRLYLTDFLYNNGAMYRLGINFIDGKINCGSQAPKIKVCK